MSEPFDKAAATYDKAFTETFTGRGQRNTVWKQLDQIIKNHPAKILKILEINCGTGEDAIYLAQQNHHVVATDISAKMIEVAQHKLSSASSLNLTFEVLDINELERIEDKFDLVFSNFGGLNCLSPLQFKEMGQKISELLKPEGVFVAVMMSRKCAWEQMYYLLKRDALQRKRRLTKDPLIVQVDGMSVSTWFYSPAECGELVRDQLIAT
jgi:ubiquinone/menaquinone biosynthesis C-methylase UbiE